MSQPKPTPPSPTPGKRKIFDCSPTPKLFSLCDLCSCWWNCMIFSEGTLEPYPYLTNLSDLFQKAEKYEDITTQPSSLSSALIPVYDKRWQFNEKKIDSKLIISPSAGVNLDEEERKLIMTMKEERHKMKLEILRAEKVNAQQQLMNTRN